MIISWFPPSEELCPFLHNKEKQEILGTSFNNDFCQVHKHTIFLVSIYRFIGWRERTTQSYTLLSGKYDTLQVIVLLH